MAINKSSIREELRKKLTKEFENKNASLIESVNNYKTLYIKEQNLNKKLRDANSKLWQENEDLKMKVAALDDQVRRLLEYMDLPEEERENAFKEYKEHLKAEKTFADMSKFINSTFGMMF